MNQFYFLFNISSFVPWGFVLLNFKSALGILILGAFGIILISLILVNIYTFSLSRQRKDMEKLVDQRTEKLNEQREALEKISRQLKEKEEEINKVHFKQEITEKKFNFIIEHAAEGIGLTDLNGNIIFANSNLCKALGYRKDEILKLSYIDFLKPENKEEAIHTIKKLVNKELEQFKIEREFVRKDKSAFWVNFSGSPILDENNEVIGLLGISTDINAKKTQELNTQFINQELKKAYLNIKLLSDIGQELTQLFTEEEIIDKAYLSLNELFEVNVFAIMTFNEKENKLEATGGIENNEKLPGFTIDLIKEKNLAALCFLKQEEIFIQNYNEEYRNYFSEMPPPKAGKNTTSIIYIPLIIQEQKLGVFTVQSFNPNAYNYNDLALLKNIGIYISIALQNAKTLSKLKNQRNEIASQAQKLQIANKEFEKLSIVANKTNNAVVIMDSRGNFDWVNEGFNQLYETTLDVFLNERGTNIFKINRDKNVDEAIRQCFDQKISVSYEFYTKTRSGKNIWIQANLTPILDENNELYKVIAIDTDITRIKEAEIRLNNQKEQIEKAYTNVQLLSEIGKEVTSSLALEKIIQTIHHQLNQLMDAPIIALGLYNSLHNSLDFIGKEKIDSEILRSTDALENKKQLSVVCFTNQEVIYIENFEKTESKYEHHKQIIHSTESQSLVYLPLTIKHKKIGVMTVQSFEPNAYSEYHINILKNIAVYAAIALENANTLNQLGIQKEKIEQQKEELEITLNNLKRTQDQLIESAKMAALGNLVAGVAHEINTPVGVGLAASSTLYRKSNEVFEKFKSGKLTKTDFEKFLEKNIIASDLIYKNLERTGELVKSFKQVSVDQSSEKKRKFFIRSYIDDVLRSLHPKTKNKGIDIEVICSNSLEIESYPGVFAQIFTNLILNSLTHGFRNKEKGKITIEVEEVKKSLLIEYADNGAGIATDVLPHIFEPFFTTNMTEGTGLGMHIIYNLITQKLKGTIDCMSKANEGVYFIIKIPFV